MFVIPDCAGDTRPRALLICVCIGSAACADADLSIYLPTYHIHLHTFIDRTFIDRKIRVDRKICGERKT